MNLDDELREQEIIEKIRNERLKKKIIIYSVVAIVLIIGIFIAVKLIKSNKSIKSSVPTAQSPNTIILNLSSSNVEVETPVNISVHLARKDENGIKPIKIPNKIIEIYAYTGLKELYGNCTTKSDGSCSLIYIPHKTGLYTIYVELKDNKTISKSAPLNSFSNPPNIGPPSLD